MQATPFEEQLLEATPEARSRLIARRPDFVGEREVHALAEQARREADARPAESLRIAEIARELAETLGGARGRALAQRAHAVALRAQSRWTEALECFEAGARMAEEAGDTLLAAQIPIAATEALAQLGRYEEALRLASSLEHRLSALGAEEDAAKVVANAGNIHFQRESYAEALECWERALAYFQSHDQPIPVARLQMNIANVLTHLHRLPDALRMYESARAALESAGLDLLVAGLDGNIGFLQFMAGRYTEALQSYTRARQRFEVLQLPKDITQCDREVADVYLQLNLIPEAQDIYERVLPAFTALQMSAEAARCEMGLAAALAAQQRGTEALKALGRAERAFHREKNELGVARVRLQRAEWWRRAGAAYPGEARVRREAMAALQTFRRRGLKMGEAHVRLLLAEMSMEAGGSPVRSLHQLLKEAEGQALVSLLWRVEAALARACAQAGKQRAALSHYRRAVEAVERLRLLLQGDDFRIAFLQDKMRLHEELLALLLDRGTRAALLEGFQLAERTKSRTLLERLAGPVEGRAAEDPQRQALLQRLEELRAQLNWDYGRAQQIDAPSSRLPRADATLPDQLHRLEREYLMTRRQLQLASVAKDALGDFGAPHLRDIQAVMDGEEQIVEYVTVRDEVLAFVIKRDYFRVVRGMASRTEVEEQVERLRFQWSKFGPGGFGDRYNVQLSAATRDILHTLYGMLLEPLETSLSAAPLTVIPHGSLHGVPFHALYNGEQYALDRWECAYAPSGAVWRACRLRGETESGQSMVFGVSDPGVEHIRDEVRELQCLLPGAKIYQDEAATLSSVPTDGTFRYVHFATHAIFRKDNPLFSSLRLFDGWLTAHDLYRRRLECNLATLSACRTGVSLVAPGDEVLGLVRGFLYAGARAVLVSLWAAHDAATAELMQTFYTQMTKGKSRAAALRAAQQALRDRFPHPYYWAAFALVGAR